MAGKKKGFVGEASKRKRFFYIGGVQTHKRLVRYIGDRYISRIQGGRGKNRTTTPITDLNTLIQKHIEERNYLISSLADWKPSEIKELWSWTVEAIYQLILSNNVKAKKTEVSRKNSEVGRKVLGNKKKNNY